MLDEDLTQRAQSRLGTVLRGKYKLDSVVGVGGMAVVYAATHRNQKRFAVKLLHAELSISPGMRDRFKREGYLANTVGHPGAVSVLDDDVDENGSAFLVMELLEGKPVEQLAAERGDRLPERVVLAVAHQLLDVLAAAHAKSIVHRDIKPANVFVTPEGSVKVLDFGIARVRLDSSGGPSVTKTGAMLGTPAFMAPEQAGGKSTQVDGQSDLWAVGASMFALLSGQMVHVGETSQRVVILAATEPARSLGTVAQDVDARVVALVDRALAYDKSDRWPSAAAMRDAVSEVYRAIFGGAVGPAPLAELFAHEGSIATTTAPGAASLPTEPANAATGLTAHAPTIPSSPQARLTTGGMASQAVATSGSDRRVAAVTVGAVGLGGALLVWRLAASPHGPSTAGPEPATASVATMAVVAPSAADPLPPTAPEPSVAPAPPPTATTAASARVRPTSAPRPAARRRPKADAGVASSPSAAKDGDWEVR